MSKKNLNDKIKSIQKECLKGKRSVKDAIDTIDEMIGGITNVIYHENLKFKIHNHNAIFDLKYKGMPKRQRDLLHGMAVVAYHKTQTNGIPQPGEVHISEEASTKHHRYGINNILNKYIN